MVPTIKINDTVGFRQPLFTNSLAGWLVLAFKITVGVALIGSVQAIVQAQRDKPDKPPPDVTLLPHATRRVLDWRTRERRRGPDVQAPETADP